MIVRVRGEAHFCSQMPGSTRGVTVHSNQQQLDGLQTATKAPVAQRVATGHHRQIAWHLMWQHCCTQGVQLRGLRHLLILAINVERRVLFPPAKFVWAQSSNRRYRRHCRHFSEAETEDPAGFKWLDIGTWPRFSSDQTKSCSLSCGLCWETVSPLRQTVSRRQVNQKENYAHLSRFVLGRLYAMDDNNDSQMSQLSYSQSQSFQDFIARRSRPSDTSGFWSQSTNGSQPSSQASC